MQSLFRFMAAAALAVVLLSTAGTARAQGGLGVVAGLNFNELGDIQTGNMDATFDNASGWHVGIFYDLPLGPLAVRPGIRYMDAGAIFESDNFNLRDDVKVSLIEIPLDVRIRLGLPFVKPYVMAGPVLRFPAGNDTDRLKEFSFAGGLGAGIELGLGGVRLFPELRYTFGISRFTKESYKLGGVTLTPDDNQQLNAIMLSLGVGL